MKYAKRVMSLTLVMGLMVSSLTGCTSSKDDTANKGDKTMLAEMQKAERLLSKALDAGRGGVQRRHPRCRQRPLQQCL